MESNSFGNVGKLSLETNSTQRVKNLGVDVAGKNVAEKKKAAQEFASLLFLEVLKAMRAALPQEGLPETESLSRDIYTTMMDSEIARVMAQRDTSGFTKMVEQSLDRITDKAREPGVNPAPTQGVVSSAFGPRIDPLNGEKGFHHGVDIAAPAGSPIKAATGGKVTFSGLTRGYGNLVEVDHGDGLVTRYAHNAVNLVAMGDEVSAGQPIALVGRTGRATDAHLHFEVRRQGKPVDPKFLLGRPVLRGTKLNAVT
jgi:murein DD-endopeptidase MepM/ murein hydrolase activator NlpD